MDRIRQIIAAVCAAAGLLASVGCTATQQSAWKTALNSSVVPPGQAGPPPAAEFGCMWQNRLALLPDPTKNGAVTPGVVGQMFLYTADLKPADIAGDLMVTVHDSTPRKAGQSPVPSEVWHFTAETLRKMTVVDERYGRALLIFLPWPESWRDVNRLYIEARYVQGEKKLYGQPTTVTLDTQAPGGMSQAPTGSTARIPDPSVLLQQAKNGQNGVSGGAAWAGPPPTGPQQPWGPPVVPASYGPPAQPPQFGGGVFAPPVLQPQLPPNQLPQPPAQLAR